MAVLKLRPSVDAANVSLNNCLLVICFERFWAVWDNMYGYMAHGLLVYGLQYIHLCSTHKTNICFLKPRSFHK
jgi:hypothetical protein